MILVTGVSGGLGRLILKGLSEFDDVSVVAGTRSGGADGGTADGGTARRVDFDDPASLPAAFDGVDVLVVVSAGYAEDDVVFARHGAVADAAATAGIRHLIYTSLAGSGETMTIALPHRWSEDRFADGPFTTTILRNGLYPDVPVMLATAGAAQAAQTGVFTAPFGEGRISVVAKRDLADAAVRVAADSDRDLAAGRPSRHAGRVYDLEGDTAIGGADIAQILTEALGRPIAYRPASLSETRAGLDGSGLEPYQITHTLSLFANVIAGRAEASGSDLPLLLAGRGARPVREAIREAVAEAVAGLSRRPSPQPQDADGTRSLSGGDPSASGSA